MVVAKPHTSVWVPLYPDSASVCSGAPGTETAICLRKYKVCSAVINAAHLCLSRAYNSRRDSAYACHTILKTKWTSVVGSDRRVDCKNEGV